MLGKKVFGDGSRRWVALLTIPTLLIGMVVGGVSLSAQAAPHIPSDDESPTSTSTATPTPSSTSHPTSSPTSRPTSMPTPTNSADPLSAPTLLSVNPSCSSNCSSLTLINEVVGGTATPADWALSATTATDSYTFVSGTSKDVTRNDTYTLSSTGGPSGYSSAVFTCDGSPSGVTFDLAAQTVTFADRSNRNATCTFTYSSTAPTTLTVHAGGLRAGPTTVGPLPNGAVFTATPVSGSPAGGPFTCTITDGSGTCQIAVPAGFAWRVGETLAPTGYYLNPSLDYGGSSTVVADTYVFTTGIVAGPTDVPGANATGTYADLRHPGANNFSGLLATSVNNPAVSQKCGLNVALVLDQSGSMAGAKQTTLKASANAAIDALTGTPSNVAIYTFATNTGSSIASTPTATVASAAPLHTFINNLGTPQNSTNWDAGLHQVPAGFDIVLFITDGAPTAYASGSGSGGNSYFQYVEQGIYSANTLKAGGTRVVGVGVGLDGAEENLRSVSGATFGSDYFLSTDADFGQVLTDLATGACNTQLSIQKQIQDPSGAVIPNSAAANGWSFTNTITTGSTIDSPSVTAVVNDQNGFASATVAIPAGATPTVTVTETLKAGYSFVSAACSVGGSPVTTNVVGTTASFTGASNAPLSCIFTNKQNPGSWDLTKTSNPASGSVVSPGDTVTYTLSAHNGSDVTVFGASATDNISNVIDDATLGALPSGVSLLGSTLTWTIGTLTAGETKTASYTVTVDADAFGATLTNVATPGTNGSCEAPADCTTTHTTPNETHLTLVKSVSNGTTGSTTGPTAWTLSAAGGTGASQVTDSLSGVVHTVIPGTYSLSESSQLPGYTSTGNWVCTGQTSQPTTSSVAIAAGQDVTCTITNTAVKSTLTLNKVVVNGDTGATHVAADWKLSATGGPTSVTDVASGTSTPVAIGTYTLGETGPDGYQASAWTCPGYAVKDSAITIPLGVDVTCTITNTAIASSLTLKKVVDNGATGATHGAGEWLLTASGSTNVDNVSTGTKTSVEIGNYVLSESGPAGYSSSGWDCGAYPVSSDSVAVPLGADVTCTITNTAQTPHITLHKDVTNDHGGSDLVGDWTLSATNRPTVVSGVSGDDAVTNVAVPVGTYVLSETGKHDSGYALTSLVCMLDGKPLSGPSATNPVVDLSLGQSVDCYFTNDDKPALLTLEKTVSKEGANSNVTPGDFTLTATPDVAGEQLPVSGPGDIDTTGAIVDTEVFAGSYTLSESGPGGFSNDGWVCNGQVLAGDTVTLANGESVHCVVTNTAILPTLTLVKKIEGNGVTGGTSTPADWTLTADGSASGGSVIAGRTTDVEITNARVAAGTYDLSENGTVTGYDASGWSCDGGAGSAAGNVAEPGLAPTPASTVVLKLGDDVTCTITNTAVQATLTLNKVVDNGSTGASHDSSEWKLSASGGPTSVTDVASGTETDVAVGTYTLGESGPSGYQASAWDCGSYDASSGSVAIPLGAAVNCTITNTAIAPTLTLYKSVEESYGGSTAASAWTLSAVKDATTVSGTSGVNASVPIGTYDLSEVADVGVVGYELTSLVCLEGKNVLTEPTATNPEITLGLGENAVCTFTNSDLPATLTLEKTVSQGGANTAFTPADWTLAATPQFGGDQATVSGPGAPGVTGGVSEVPVFSGTYQLSESGPDGFTAGTWQCDGGSLDGDLLTVENGESVGCSITNTAILPKLTLVKKILNDGTAGVGTVRSWTLTADGTQSGGSSISGLSGDTAIDHASVAAGTYALSETNGPEGYDSAGWTCEDATLAGPVSMGAVTEGSIGLTLGQDVTCTITNVAQAPVYNDAKTSDPASGSVVQPGQTITYRIDLTHTGGVVPLNRTITDDMSDVLNNATFIEGSITASQGEAVLEGTTLTWETGSFADTVSLTYQVVVNADAFGQTLRNVITPVTGGECDGQCSTTHYVANVDMAIQKGHSTTHEDNSVVSGQDNLINYRLDVSNQGATPGKDDATGVTVRDTMAFALTLDTAGLAALNPSGDWDFSESTAGQLVAHYIGNGGVFVVGTSSTILYVATVGTLVPPGGNLPTSEIDNEGCVAAAETEANLSNNCSPDATIAKWVLIDPSPFCRNNTPYVSYSIPLSNGAVAPFVALIWWTPEAFAARTIGIDPADTAAILADGASQIDTVPIPAGWQNGDAITGEQLWPGAAVDMSGNPTAWPGWTQSASGQWVLDAGAPFYNIRDNAIIEVRTTSAGEAFAQATLSIPGCDPSGSNTTPTVLTYTGLSTATWLLSGAYLVGIGIVTVWTHRRIRRYGQKKKV